MDISVVFSNPQQREFYYATQRNQTFSGGFNNGKTYAGCLKALSLLTTFPKYKMAIARQVYKDLKISTMETFMKMCPRDLISSHNGQDGLTQLHNGGVIHWLHLDKVEDSTLRGLEINSALVDQAEETEEKAIDILDARIGRWDGAEVPEKLLEWHLNEYGREWPSKKGKWIVPSYLMLLCNPDTQYHHIYRKYHPDSLERRTNYFFVEGEWDASLGSEESYTEAAKHDSEWVEKYIKGKWGISNAQIHRLDSQSLLEPDEDFIQKLLRKGNLFRILDHGDSAPTCCLWASVLSGNIIFYREYYQPNQVISKHRQAIFDLSENEKYSSNYADPQIFKKTAQKDGGFWSVADEYRDRKLEAPPLLWLPADNNEYATRNRINEFLRPNKLATHPITGTSDSPRIYFVKKTKEHPYGCFHSINELQAQRRKLLGYFDGKAIYCDDRQDGVADHAYDCVRYFVAMHGSDRQIPQRRIPERSLDWYRKLRKNEAKAPLEAMSV